MVSVCEGAPCTLCSLVQFERCETELQDSESENTRLQADTSTELFKRCSGQMIG
jgi:hypothetical protein